MAKHGAPDWAKYRRDSATFPIEDLAELAARLGSIVTYDRRGDIILLDDFEDGLNKCKLNLGGLTSVIAPEPAAARSGGYCAKLTTPVDSAAGCGIEYYLAPLTESKYGIEFAFGHSTPPRYVWAILYIHRDGTAYQLQARYDRTDEVLQIYDDTPTWVTIASNLTLDDRDLPIHTIKLVVDSTTLTYVRLLLDDHEYNISAHAPGTYSPGEPDHLRANVHAGHDAAVHKYLYVDNVIITQDEP